MAAVLAQIAPLTMPWVTTGSNSAASGSGAFVANTGGTLNKANAMGLNIPFTKTSTKICYEIGATADNTAATYDLGLWTGTSGGSGTLIANTGAIAGTTFAPSTSLTRCQNWSQGTITIPAGRIYIGLTTSQSGTVAVLFTAATGWAYSGLTQVSITAGGTLNTGVTLPTDINSGAGITAATTPWFSIQ